MKIGAHIGYTFEMTEILESAESIGLDGFQCFLPIEKSWPNFPSKLNENEMSFKKKKENLKLFGVAHAHFTTIPSHKTSQKIVTEVIVENLKTCEMLGIEYLVVHVGSAQKANTEDSIIYVGTKLKSVLKSYQGNVQLLLENSAGGGSQFACTPEIIEKIVNYVSDPRLGICWDTGHSYAAGITFEELYNDLKPLIEKKYLRLFHFNMPDLKVKLGSHLDRHGSSINNNQNISEGLLKLRDFFNEIPVILERGSIEAILDDLDLIKWRV